MTHHQAGRYVEVELLRRRPGRRGLNHPGIFFVDFDFADDAPHRVNLAEMELVIKLALTPAVG